MAGVGVKMCPKQHGNAPKKMIARWARFELFSSFFSWYLRFWEELFPDTSVLKVKTLAQLTPKL